MPPISAIRPLSASLAHLLTLGFACSYVGSLYILKNARLSFLPGTESGRNGQIKSKQQGQRWRDDADVIRARLLAVSLATLFCCATVLVVIWNLTGVTSSAISATSSHLGFTLRGVSIQSFLEVPILFLGPLYVRYLYGQISLQESWSFSHSLHWLFSLEGTRNYIVAPVTEEIVFRACILSVYQLSGASAIQMLYLSPISFGAAHLHHAWEVYNRYGRTSDAIKRAVITTAIQFTYTSIFGSYCAYLFLRSGSIFPPIFAHIFCNVMGLPQPVLEIRQFPDRKWAIIAAYLIGIIAFASMLGPRSYAANNVYWA